MRYAIVLLVLLAGCGNDAAAPKAIVPSLSIVVGDGQTDTVGKTLPVQLGAKLTDATTGLPLPGRVLNWVIVTGGGQLFVGVTQTATDGTGRNSWTLGPNAGGQTVVARYIDPETGATVTFDTAKVTAIPASAWAFEAGFGPNANPNGVNYLAAGDTGLVVYDFKDVHGNQTTSCADQGAWDRVTWFSADSAALTPLGTVVVLKDGRHATQVLANAGHAGPVEIRGDGGSCVPPAGSPRAGVVFITQ